MKATVDYAGLRGFNYTQSNAWNDHDFWSRYDHAIVERDMGYAHRLNLNSARIFLPYPCYAANPERFLADVRDFVQTAWSHGISTSPIIYHGFRFHPEDAVFRPYPKGGLPPLSRTIEDPSCWHIGEAYFDALYAAIGQEPGLLFWDISNEPGYTDDFVTWYDEEPRYVQDYASRPDLEELRAKQEKTWECVRHFCRYVKAKDPEHDIGIDNIFIWETEPSATAELVDVIIFHDYSTTRKRLRGVLETAQELGRKYGKPVLDNEMCCLARANPYDMSIQLHNEYGVGWYLFELMIGEDGWNRVHGVVYPDGTVRDPAIPAAILGFYRNRSETALRADVNQEDHLRKVTILAERTLAATRSGLFTRDHTGDAEQLLEVCEYAANLLEAGELVPMAYPPTARIAALRRQPAPNADEARDLLCELLAVLRNACHIVG